MGIRKGVGVGIDKAQIISAPAIPSGYVLLKGTDGQYLKGADGAFLYGRSS